MEDVAAGCVAQRVLGDLLYLKIRRGTQVAQGRGLQNLHSWVRIPPAPPNFSFQINGLQLSFLSRHPQLGTFRGLARKCRTSGWANWAGSPVPGLRLIWVDHRSELFGESSPFSNR